MLDKKNRKISYNTLIRKTWASHEEEPFLEIDKIINYIKGLKILEKKHDLKDSKFCLMQTANIEKTSDDELIIDGFFKNARSNFRPNLIDRNTAIEEKVLNL